MLDIFFGFSLAVNAGSLALIIYLLKQIDELTDYKEMVESAAFIEPANEQPYNNPPQNNGNKIFAALSRLRNGNAPSRRMW